MLKNKETAQSAEKPVKKGALRKLVGYLSKKLDKSSSAKNSITTIMHMQSGHFGQLDTTHFTNFDRDREKKHAEALAASLSDRGLEGSSQAAGDPDEQHRLWKLQVSKCYRRIPPSFFESDHELPPLLLSKNKQKSLCSQLELADFLDEVEFNLSSHVNSRFREFFEFITSMGQIEHLVEFNLERLRRLRLHNTTIQQNLLDKAEHVRVLRIRADNLERYRVALENTKRMVALPKDIRNAFPRDKTKALYLFNLYKSLHDRSRLYCCLNKKVSCRFEEVQQYLRQNFQVAFTKSFWSYITEVIVYDQETLQSIFGLNKKQFMTTPNFLQSLADKPKLEESRWQEPQEIVIKENIEAEINWIAVNGFTLCNLTCNTLIRDLVEFMNSFQKNFLSDLIDKIRQSFDISSPNNLLILSKSRQTIISELQPLFEKVTFGKFIRVIETYSEVMQKVVRRCLSIVNRILQSFCKIKPSNQRELEDSLLEVANVVIEFSSTGLLSIVKLKRISNEFQAAHFKDLLRVFEEWAEFSKQMHDIYLQPLPIFGASIQRTQSLIESVALETLRKSYMHSYFSNLHQFSLSNRLKKALEGDNWQEVDIEPDYFQSLGYLLEGQKFLQSRRNKMMTSSILFEKKPLSTSHIELPCNEFRVTNKQIVIRQKRFKATSSTLQLLETLEEYLKIHQSCQELSKEIAEKLIELLKAYTSYLEELILRGRALQLKRIKGNSITARHLSLCYLAIEIILELLPSINRHLPLPSQEHHKLVQKLHSHEDEIIKKFHSVMICTMEQECKLVELKPPVPSQGTRKILDHIRSMYDILADYFSEEDMRKFFSKHYLRKYIDTLQRLKPADTHQAELKAEEISYFLKESSQFEAFLSDYDKMAGELRRMLSLLSK